MSATPIRHADGTLLGYLNHADGRWEVLDVNERPAAEFETRREARAFIARCRAAV